MIRIMREGINPILNQYRLCCDECASWHRPRRKCRQGAHAGRDTFNVEGKKLKTPHFDILGYTINIATKMTTLGKPDQIVIGQMVYDVLDDRQKSTFQRLQINPDVWGYMSDYYWATISTLRHM